MSLKLSEGQRSSSSSSSSNRILFSILSHGQGVRYLLKTGSENVNGLHSLLLSGYRAIEPGHCKFLSVFNEDEQI